mmetsp:Transcript_28816/g.91839  ORF Transcript_28816/g.91839 Transcript_28816/m.91839 type:complete len:435 (+) Transcript_28816:226-1530(+)
MKAAAANVGGHWPALRRDELAAGRAEAWPEGRREAPCERHLPVDARQPRVGLQARGRREPLLHVGPEQRPHEQRGILRMRVLKLELALHYQLEEPLLIRVPEGRSALQHLEHEHACGPPIKLAGIALALEDLWREVLRRAADRGGHVLARQAHLGEPEVREPHVPVGVQKHVLRLQVTVGDVALVDVLQRLHDAGNVEEDDGDPLVDVKDLPVPLVDPHRVLQAASLHCFQQHVHEQVVSVGGVEPDDEVAIDHGVKVPLHADMGLHAVFTHAPLGDLLHSVPSPCALLLFQQHRAECTLPKRPHERELRGVRGLRLPRALLVRVKIDVQESQTYFWQAPNDPAVKAQADGTFRPRIHGVGLDLPAKEGADAEVVATPEDPQLALAAVGGDDRALGYDVPLGSRLLLALLQHALVGFEGDHVAGAPRKLGALGL